MGMERREWLGKRRGRGKKKKEMVSEKKEEKRWSQGWVVLMANGYGEKRVAREEGKKKKKKGGSEG